ncbi:prolyl oligopeptidase family serine peptidase [Shewanella sp. SG41-4]|uniref:alpha/beta hydrolase family protein n=1 Tax=Shewanella sp. SG41-4 TaxID=2760976 RepID=UPI0016035739|nr:prolyl oligopeptidase family serine peptidase [Shewanella sp. SG41-4]MBB1440907.1 prolyl oligopeptidase family serine peptidase [Shewanella sp. SG41-4]
MKYLGFIFLSIISTALSANEVDQNGKIYNQRDCFSGPFTSYDNWINFMERKFSRKIKNPELLKNKMDGFKKQFDKDEFNTYSNNLSCTNFTYNVEGTDVLGFVIKPKESTTDLPVIVYNRGGNGNFGGVVFGAMMNNLFPIANKGFVIVGSQYRGTFGSPDKGEQDQFGGSDVQDVVGLVNLIGEFDGADTSKIGMLGASRGGMQSFLALKQLNNIKAVATIALNADLNADLATRPEMEKVYKHRIPGYKGNENKKLAERSVINWVDKLPSGVPILLIHGENDVRVSASHSKTFAKALKETEIEHKLVIYADNHFISSNTTKAHNEITKWFTENL